MPQVSVIIPCYNHGDYIEEAVDSVLAQTFKDFEIIIVNDGSADERTINLLRDYKKPKTTVIHTPHRGLGEARNAGIRNSSGKYILPLDADDKISPGYLAEATRVLDDNDEVKIVYCEAEWFGEKSGPFKPIPFSMPGMLIDNLIFCSAFFRRRDYDLTNGYNKTLKSCEDWDFWLSLLEKGGRVYKIQKTHFYYRFRRSSMLQTLNPRAREYVAKQVYLNHIELYARQFYNPITLYHEKEKYKQLYNSYDYKLGRLILKPFRYTKRMLLHVKRWKKADIRAHSTESFIYAYPPTVYHFLMTNYCNAHCIFCNQRFDSQSKKEISLEQFKTMVSHIPITAVEDFHFTGGGEPLLCRDLLPIIKYVNESFPWIRVIIRTNGLLIGQYAKELAQSNIARLEISIHGMAETNDIILQRKGSQAIFDGIVILNKYLEQYNSRMCIEFIPAVSLLNINDIPELIKKANELKVNSVRVYFCRYFPYKKLRPNVTSELRTLPCEVSVVRKVFYTFLHHKKREENRLLKEGDSLFFHKWRYNNMILKSKRLAKSLGVDFFYDPLFFSYSLKLKKASCCQPWIIMLVDWDGDVYPCCGGEEWFKAKVKSGEYHFGNLLKEDVYQCWNGPTYLMIRKTCSPTCKDELISECKNCHSTIYFKGPNVKNAHIIRTNEKG